MATDGTSRSQSDSISDSEGALPDDLRRSFEQARIALENRNETIARYTRSLNELVDVFDEAVMLLREAGRADRR